MVGDPQAREGRTIYEYDNYREFLKDRYSQAKLRDKKFSIRYYSRLAGFKSSSFFKHVIDGERNLTAQSAEKLAKALQLDRHETSYFVSLVGFNQATRTEEKNMYTQQLLRSRTLKKLFPLLPSQYNYFSHWHYSAIRELVLVDGFKEDPEWISKRLNPHVPPAEVKRALENLLKLGMLSRDSAGKLIQTEAHVTSGDEATFISAAQCHREFLACASESIDTIARDKRDLSAMTFVINEQTYAQLKAAITEFRQKIRDIVAARESAPTSVYQINFQLFPLVKPEESK